MIKGFIVAMQFLTRLPINISIDFNEENIGRATFFFPYVGMILGLISYIPYHILGNYYKNLASFLIVFLMIVLTGGLHLDGLSDMVDGFLANRDKDETMKIMHDSRIGAFGVLSLILIILFKYITISSFESNLCLAVVLSMGNARFVSLIQIYFKKMARPGGLGDMIHSSYNKKYIISSLLSYILLNLILNKIYLIPLIISVLLGEIISKITYRKLGGFTGDGYGAVIEVTEAISLLSFLGVLKWI